MLHRNGRKYQKEIDSFSTAVTNNGTLYEFAVQTAQVFIAAAVFYERDLVSILNV